MNFLFKSKVATGTGLALVAGSALADTPPASLTDLTGAISFAAMTAAVLAVSLLIINYKVIKQGALVVMRAIGLAK
jgi:hypothetical protein